MKFFLIGMPGSGKTTLGKALAEHLAVPFVDLDTEIEKAEGKSISDIFSTAGHDHFRLIESRLLREWAAGTHAFVMATGGGAPCFHDGIDVINQSGLSVFLDCPVDVLLARVRKNQLRPLLRAADEEAARKKLETMRAERMVCYRKAQIVVEEPTLERVLSHIEPRLRK